MTKENLDPTDEESQKLHNSLQVEGKRGTSSNMPAFMTKLLEYWKIGIAVVLAVIVLVIVAIAFSFRGGGGENTKPPVDPMTPTPKPPNDDELEVTDKITFTVATVNEGIQMGSFDIGIFGDMFPKTRKNFIALAEGTLPYKYVGSTFPDDGSDDDYFMRGGDNVEPNSRGGYCIYGADDETNRYWKKDQNNTDLIWENVTESDLINCRRKGWVAMEDITEDETNPAYNSKFKIFTDDVTWDGDDSERDLVFGKVLDNGMDSLEDIKSKCIKCIPDESESDLVFGKVLDDGMDDVEKIKNCTITYDCMIQNAVVHKKQNEKIPKPVC